VHVSFLLKVTTIPSGTRPGKVSRVGVGGTVGGIEVAVGGMAVGVLVGIGVDVGASAVWVANCAAAVPVALASSSAWDGPQELPNRITNSTAKRVVEVFFRFIIIPPNLPCYVENSLLTSIEGKQEKITKKAESRLRSGNSASRINPRRDVRLQCNPHCMVSHNWRQIHKHSLGGIFRLEMVYTGFNVMEDGVLGAGNVTSPVNGKKERIYPGRLD